jgi:methyl-accepting chemotaxis protein
MPIAISQAASTGQAHGAPAHGQRSDHVSSGSSDRDGFFRHHGLWAPGIRLFRRLGFNAKAGVITLTFLLPITVLGWNYFASQAELIAFSAKEQDGSAYIHEAYALLPLLTQARRADGAEAHGDAKTLAELRARIQEALGRLQTAEAAHGPDLGTGTAHQGFVALAQSLLANDTTGEVHRAAANSALQALVELIAAASDGSNLTLDPDIDTYYLMDATMFRLPAMIDAADQVGTQGAAVLTQGSLAPDVQRRLIEQTATLVNGLSGLKTSVAKTQAGNASVKQRVQAQEAAQAVTALVDLLERHVLPEEGVRGQAAELREASRQAEAALLRLSEQTASSMDNLLAARVGRIVSARNVTLVLVCVSLLVAAYLFTAFRKVLQGGLREVAFHMERIRDGNLTARPHAWGADEAAMLIRSLSQMREAMQGLVSQVRQTTDGIVVASGEIAAGAADMSGRIEQSASNLQHTASAMEEISAGVRNNETAVSSAADIAQTNAQAAQRGGEVVEALIVRMQRIDASSSRIQDIIGTIDGIAFQTNILALNAAVESARAGEHGRGFAVVAAEVRALAKRSSDAAREIKSLIADSVMQVQGGMDVARQAGTLMATVVQSSDAVTRHLHEAVAGAHEQTLGIASTTLAMQELDATTQHNASLVEQTSCAAAALRDQAQALAAQVARFTLSA